MLVKDMLYAPDDLHFEGELAVSGRGGGCWDVSGDVTLAEGSVLNFSNCHANFGGALRIEGHLVMTSALLAVRNSTATSKGGGIYAVGILNLTNSSLHVESCKARTAGGISSYGMLLTNSILKLSNCHAELFGGGIRSYADVTVANSSLHFDSCKSAMVGGGVSIKQERWLTLTNSSMHFDSCEAASDGGGIHVNHFDTGIKLLDGSTATFDSCSSYGGGGGITTGSFLVSGNSSAAFRRCHAKHNAGSICTLSNMTVMDSSTVHVDSSTSALGGALFVDSLYVQHASNFTAANCSANAGGTIAVLHGVFITEESMLSISGSVAQCAAEKPMDAFKILSGRCYAAGPCLLNPGFPGNYKHGEVCRTTVTRSGELDIKFSGISGYAPLQESEII